MQNRQTTFAAERPFLGAPVVRARLAELLQFEGETLEDETVARSFNGVRIVGDFEYAVFER